jgi:ABC-type phosphate/phosphonate transport system substrate-binding protein
MKGDEQEVMKHVTSHLIWVIVLLILCGVLLAGCLSREGRVDIELDDRVGDVELHEITVASDADVLRFGFALRSSPQEDARQYLPFLQYLEEATGHAFELHFTLPDEHSIDNLGAEVVQFAVRVVKKQRRSIGTRKGGEE